MRILLVAATEPETSLLRANIEFSQYSDILWKGTFANHEIHLLQTGIGIVNTAFSLGRYMAAYWPHHAINLGICGSFKLDLPLGIVVEVVEDSFSEMGAEDKENFLDLEDMGFPLLTTRSQTMYNTLKNPSPFPNELPKVSGITVNKVHGRQSSIDKVTAQWGKVVETMESAAFFHAMLAADIPFSAFRAISNYVTPRNKADWQIVKASRQVQKYVLSFIPSM